MPEQLWSVWWFGLGWGLGWVMGGLVLWLKASQALDQIQAQLDELD